MCFLLKFGKFIEVGGEEYWCVGGVMLQYMFKVLFFVFGEGGFGEGGMLMVLDFLFEDDEENWNCVNILLNFVEELELIGLLVILVDFLVCLFYEEVLCVFDVQVVKFGCSCFEDKVC